MFLSDGDKLSDRGHYFVITGYSEAQQMNILLLQDPFYGESEIPYEKLSSKDFGGGYRPGRGVWRGTFLLRSQRADVSAA